MPENSPFPSIFENPLASFFDAAIEQVGESLETKRQNFYIISKMQESGDNTMAGILINQSGRDGMPVNGETKEQQRSRDHQFLLLLHSIQQMESQLEDKYGENFAEQLAAEHLDEETYQKIMAIEDQDERRAAIALALKEGIENGTIDPAVFDDPQIREWIEARSQQENEIVYQASLAKQSESTQIAGTDIDQSYSFEKSTKEASALDKFF